MSAPHGWKIGSFSPEQGMGHIRSEVSGEEVAFAVEAWTPCHPVLARRMQDSETRRAELLPRPGEPVQVEWRTSRVGTTVPARVSRTVPIDLPPERSFLDWLSEVGRHVAEVRDWTDEEWTALFGALVDDIEDTIRSEDPAGPEHHLALLEWLRHNAPGALVARRLAWVVIDAAHADLVALEAANDTGRVVVTWPAATVEALVAAKLVARAPV